MNHAAQCLRFDQHSTEKRNQMSDWCPMCANQQYGNWRTEFCRI